jgi:hypothetical protein
MEQNKLPLWHLALWIIVVSWIMSTHSEIKRIDRDLSYLLKESHYHELMLEGLIEKRKVN